MSGKSEGADPAEASVESVGWPAIEMGVRIWPARGGDGPPSRQWSLTAPPSAVARMAKGLGRDRLAWGESELSWALAKGETPAGPAAVFRGVCDLVAALLERSSAAEGLTGSACFEERGLGRERRWGPEGAKAREASSVGVKIHLRPERDLAQPKGWDEKASAALMGRLEAALAEFGAEGVKSPGAPKAARAKKAASAPQAHGQGGGCCFLEGEGSALACWVRPADWARFKRESAWARALGGSDWAAAWALRSSAALGELGNAASWSFSTSKSGWTQCSSGCDWDCPPALYQAKLKEVFGEAAVGPAERVELPEDYSDRREALRQWAGRAPARAAAYEEAREIGSAAAAPKPAARPKGL